MRASESQPVARERGSAKAAVRAAKLALVFLGTRGNTLVKSSRHRLHSALLVRCAGESAMIDCGADWRRMIERVSPSAIVLTHGHADHALGLVKGAPCPVYATKETWVLLDRFPIADRRVIRPYIPFRLGALRFTAFPLVHSLRAPAVGYRISSGHTSFFYAPDLVSIRDRGRALRRIKIYIGDGATILRPMVQQRQCGSIGHSPIRAQLDWCRKERVRDAIFTHCGSQIVRGDAREMSGLVGRLGRERGISARIAYDGMHLALPVQRG